MDDNSHAAKLRHSSLFYCSSIPFIFNELDWWKTLESDFFSIWVFDIAFELYLTLVCFLTKLFLVDLIALFAVIIVRFLFLCIDDIYNYLLKF